MGFLVDQLLTRWCIDCKNSAQCAPAKHHYDECVERVTQQESEEGGAKEDCVEECTCSTPMAARGSFIESIEHAAVSPRPIADIFQSSTSFTAPAAALLPSSGRSSSKRPHRPAVRLDAICTDEMTIPHRYHANCRDEAVARSYHLGVSLYDLLILGLGAPSERCPEWRPFLYHTLQRPKIDFSSPCIT